jgi:uncharacterized membrane protein YphA (DoxX/SURF4 family)
MSALASWRGHRWLGLGVRLYLAGVFLLACLHKIAHPADFALDVATYQLLPHALVNPFAIVLPWVELAAALGLVLGLRARAFALLVALMMLSFLAALVWALHLHLEMSCGCFASQGAAADPISWRTLVRDGAWLAMAAYVVALDRRPLGLETLLRGRGASRP